MTFAPLFKRTTGGAIQIWQIRVVAQDDGTAIIVTSHGHVGGKLQETQKTIRVGKNIGRKNESSPQQQAIAEAEASWRKRQDRDRYGLTVDESDNKQLLAPMLAQSWVDGTGELTSYARKVDWTDTQHLHMQPKFDGHRCLITHDDTHGIRLFTRKGVQVTTCGHIVEQLAAVMPDGGVLDGELYAHDVPVTTIGGLIAKQQAGTETLQLLLYDCFMPLPFRQRLARIRALLQPAQLSHVQLAETQSVESPDALLAYQAQCVAAGYEGAMLRHGRDGYANGARSASLLKVKTFQDAEFTVVGCKEGQGKFAGAAVFECVTSAGHKFDCTAPGDMATKQAYWRQQAQFVGRRLTIKFQRYTGTAESVPFQPVAKGFVD